MDSFHSKFVLMLDLAMGHKGQDQQKSWACTRKGYFVPIPDPGEEQE